MLAPELAGMADDWWIISGAAVAMHGVANVEVADVDLLVSLRDAEPLASRIGIALAPGEGHDLFRSALFGRWPEPPLPVEIMAGFHVRSVNGWSEVWPTTREAVTVEGAAVFVPSREELGRMLLGFGRPKDRARAKLLSGVEVH
jgi:hypothetical protein